MALDRFTRNAGDEQLGRTFRVIREGGEVVKFVSRGITQALPNPVYYVASTLRDAPGDGVPVTLPNGWTPEVLEQIAGLTCQYGRDYELTAKQAEELVEAAREALRANESLQRLSPGTIDHITWMIDVIENPPAAVSTDRIPGHPHLSAFLDNEEARHDRF